MVVSSATSGTLSQIPSECLHVVYTTKNDRRSLPFDRGYLTFAQRHTRDKKRNQQKVARRKNRK